MRNNSFPWGTYFIGEKIIYRKIRMGRDMRPDERTRKSPVGGTRPSSCAGRSTCKYSVGALHLYNIDYVVLLLNKREMQQPPTFSNGFSAKVASQSVWLRKRKTMPRQRQLHNVHGMMPYLPSRTATETHPTAFFETEVATRSPTTY